MISLLAIVYTLGLLPLYYHHMRLVNPAAIELGSPNVRRSQYWDIESAISYYQWPEFLTDAKRQWTLICTWCVVIAPLSMALLQIPGVMESAMARTFTFATLIFSGSGIINSAIYIALGLNKGNVEYRDRWIQASQSLEGKESVQFWVSMMTSIISFIWSFIFFTITLFIVAWLPHEQSDSMVEPSNIPGLVSGTLLSILFLGNLFQIFCTAKAVGWLKICR